MTTLDDSPFDAAASASHPASIAAARTAGVASPWVVATSAQTPPRPPGQVPFLNFPKPARRKHRPRRRAHGRARCQELARRQGFAQARRASAARQRTADDPQRTEEGARAGSVCGVRSIRSATTGASSTASSSTPPRACATIEQQIAAGEQRLPPLDEKEATLRASLDARRTSSAMCWRRCNASAATRRRRCW